MKTLGVDLASQPRLTALCRIDWLNDLVEVHLPQVGCTDDVIIAETQQADITGIDAPFGFPEPFADAVATWRIAGGWPPTATHDLRFRRTDLFVREVTGRWPLSVSSDLIALPAWRCACLLTQLNIRIRDGSEGVVEVYPGAALSAWGFERAGYKTSADVRALLVDAMVDRGRGWLTVSDDVRIALVASDHALDAFIAALVARATALGRTLEPKPDAKHEAQVEGWIHLPRPDSFEQLADQA